MLTPSLPFAAAEKALAAAVERGVERDALLAAAALAEPVETLSYAQLCALYESAARLTGDDAFGLHVGERTSPTMYRELGYVAANSATLAEALASLERLTPIWTRAVGIAVERGRTRVALRYWHASALSAKHRRQENEQMLAALLAFARIGTDSAISPSEVRFEHAPPPQRDEHDRVFGRRIFFGSADTRLVLPRAALALPMRHADPVLHELIEAQAEAVLARQVRDEPLFDRLRDLARQATLSRRELTLDTAATAIGLGSRTLQRRLRERGLSFREVLEEARLAEGKALLAQTGLAPAEIAFQLGYSQSSAFHRAFRRACGTTPGAYRSSRRVLPS